MKFPYDSVPNSPGKRWFVEYGGKVKYDRGFADADEAIAWMDRLIDSGKIIWSNSFSFRCKGCKYDARIVDRSGKEPKA